MYQSGYIMMLSLVMVAGLMIMVTSIVNQVRITRQAMRIVAERAQAQQLALAGIQLAYAQLAAPTDQKSTGTATSTNALKEFVTYSSWWQEYELTQEKEGVNGTISIYLVPDEGKININALYDFKEKKFIKNPRFDARSFLSSIDEKLKPILKMSLIEPLEKFLREQNGPLDDITQLKAIPEFAPLLDTFFAQPPVKEQQFKPALSDIFTVVPSQRIYPAMLSLNMQWAFGLQDPSVNLKQARNELASKIKENSDLQTEWNTFYTSIYKKKFTELQGEFKLLLDTKFEGRFFSLISYGKIGPITQRLYALIERVVNRDKTVTYFVRKLYWI